MTHVVSGKLRKAPFVKDGCGQDSQSRMYAVELSEMNTDYRSGEKQYTNYKAVLFAKSDAAKSFYDQALAEGSFVVITCDKLKVESRDHNGKTYISLSMENARMEGASFGGASPSQKGQQAQQQTSNQRQPQQQTQQFDDSIPF